MTQQTEAIPETGGGDDGGETNVRILDDGKPLCTWSEDADEHRRAFIIDRMADAEIDGQVLVWNMDAVFKWLKDGTVSMKQRTLKLTKKDEA